MVAATQFVEAAPVGEVKQPRPTRTLLGVEARHAPPDGAEDVLHDLLGRGTLQPQGGLAEDEPSVVVMERRERGFGSRAPATIRACSLLATLPTGRHRGWSSSPSARANADWPVVRVCVEVVRSVAAHGCVLSPAASAGLGV